MWGCVSSGIHSTDRIPVERTSQGKAITSEEKETLVALARKTIPGHRIRSIELHSWAHPNDLPVATVHFEPVTLDDQRCEFITLTFRNRNWHHRWDEKPPEDVFPPETCWLLDKESRRSKIKHRFRYREKDIFLSVSEENKREDIFSILKHFEEGRAVRQDGKPMTHDFSGRDTAIRIYTKDGSTFVDVSWSSRLTGGTHTFKLVGNKLVLENIRHWVS